VDTVYLLKCADFLKIGFTSTPLAKRLSQIRNACPFQIDVLAVRPGTLDDEAMLHEGSKEWLHDFGGRSWYRDTVELRTYLDRYFYADREIVYEQPVSELPAGGGEPLADPEALFAGLLESEPLFGDGPDRFRQGTEAAARMADKLAKGVLSGEALPSCANPILVSGALAILAQEIRSLQPTE